MAESLDFRPVLKEIEAKRIASEEKRERQLAIREDKDREALNKINQKLKNANETQKKALEAQKLQIQIDAKERASEGMRVSDQVQAIKDQKDAQAEIAKKIEANGGKADQNLEFLKRNNKIQIEELKLAQSQATSPSQQKEIAKDLRKARIEGLKLALDPVLTPLSQGIGVLNKGLGRVVPGLTVGRLALLASIPIIIKFLRSESFKKVVDFLVDNGEDMVRTAVSAIMSIGNFLSFIGKTVKETLQFLGLIEKDVKDANEEASRFTSENLGIALGLNILRGALQGVGALLRSVGTRLGFLTGATQVKAGGVAKQFGLKEGQTFTDKEGKSFRVTKQGFVQEFDPETGIGKTLQKQGPLLERLAKEGALEPTIGQKAQQKILKVGARGINTIGFLNSVFKRLPILGQLFAIGDIVRIIGSDDPIGKKVVDLTGVLAGIGGGALGAILFGAAGGFAGPLGSLVAGGIGGIGGYFASDMLARGLAQYALGQQVDAFPPNFFGVNINDILNGVQGKTPTTSIIPDASQGLTIKDFEGMISPGSSADPTFERRGFEGVTDEQLKKIPLGFLQPTSSLSTGSGASSLVPANVRTDRVDLLATNATLKSMNFDGGGSVAVVNAVTTNDNKSSSNFFGMNFVQNPNPPRMNGVDITNAVMT